MPRDSSDLTVAELKEKLRTRGLSTAGSKAELILRPKEADPLDSWVESGRSGSVEDVEGVEDTEDEARKSMSRREIELYKREKELAERELDLARREILLLQERLTERENPAGEVATTMKPATMMTTTTTTEAVMAMNPDNEEISRMHPRASLTTIADLLSDFDGISNNFETWKKQLRFLKATYQLDNDCAKLLIGMRLKKRASEWFHSKPEYIEMTFEKLLEELGIMFQHHENKLHLRRQFENRVWKKEETFQEYLHDKTIIGNRVPIERDELLEYIIEGIPDITMRDQARIQGFSSVNGLLKAFEKITLHDRSVTNSNQRSNDRGITKNKKKNVTDINNKRCFNCGEREHISTNCPTKALGAKCFECGMRGHISAKCSKKNSSVGKSIVTSISRILNKRNTQTVTLGGRVITALIDTGSDISIMRASEYAMLGSPKMQKSNAKFCGIGGFSTRTLGEFCTDILIDEHTYPILIRVVPDTVIPYDLLIGADFIDTVEINFKKGVISITPAYELMVNDESRPEIFAIDIVHDSDIIEVDMPLISEYNHAVMDLVNKYKPTKTQEIDTKMTIILTNDEPVYQKARRLSQYERDIVNTQIDEWKEEGIIRESVSDFASPIVLVKKKNGSYRLCVDYRMLNKKIIKDRYPLPLIEDQLDHLQSARVFSTIDLKNGFFHVRMDEASIKYTSFIVPDGQYEFLRVPFGLCNSPSVFQRFINVVFRDVVKQKIVLVYMDDLIVLSANEDEGLKNLKIVLDIASQAGLIINWKKCCFLRRIVEFLGHVIENGTIRPSEQKTKAVICYPEPENTRQVQSFLGLSGYFRKFVPKYSIIARPLSNLLRMGARFQFSAIERNAFEQLKIILSERPVLNLFQIGAETELHTDASMHGFGAILLQKNSEDQTLHPVYFASGKTTPAEEKYPSYELEVLAIVKALKRFRTYLLGIRFKIVTDCRAFAQTMSKKDLCVRVARWALSLEEFQYIIEHRPGKSMAHVDALSRNPLPTCLMVSECNRGLLARLKRAQSMDSDLREMFKMIQQDQLDGYLIRGGVLYKEDDGDIRLVVPKTMQLQMIRRVHEQGHFGIAKTETLVRKDYWIPNLYTKVKSVLQNCIPCILAERKHGKGECYLSPINKGDTPLDTFHVDYLGPLQSTKKNYVHIFVVVDAFSKFVWLYTTRSASAAEAVERLRRQSSTFGNPRRIVSDRGTAFTSKEFEEYCQSENIEHQLTTTGIPRANGQVERVNRTLIPLLTKLSAPKPSEWYKYLSIVQMCLNTTIQRSIGMTPFRVLLGIHPRIKDNPDIRELLENEIITSFDDDRIKLRTEAKKNIEKVQQENRKTYDKKRKKPLNYHEGDLVAIKRTQQGPHLKLAQKYLGPYEIMKVLRNHRYLLHKIGESEGPMQTSSAADYMKPWIQDDDYNAIEDNYNELEDTENSERSGRP